METEETISTDVSTEDQTMDTEALAAEEARKIAGSESDVDWSDDDPETHKPDAPEAGNTEKDAQSPDARQPEGDEVEENDAANEEATDAPAESDEEEAVKAEAERLMRQRMGLAPIKGDENYEAMERKYQESSREAHRLQDEIKAKESALKELGVKIIQNEQGQFAVAPTEEYGKNFDVSEVAKQIQANLPDELDQAFDSDDLRNKVIEYVSKEAHRIELSKRPVTNATSDDIRLDDGIVDSIFNDMCNEKIGEGDNAMPLYADIENDDVVGHMLELFQHPAARDFYIQAHKNPENMKWFLSAIHAQVFRGRAPVLAKLADAKKQKAKIKSEKVRDASVSTDSGKSASDVSSSAGNTVDEAAAIAGTGSGNHWL